MKRLSLIPAVALVFATLAACDLKSVVGDLVKSPDGGSTSDAGDVSGCNMLVNGAPVVSKTTNAGATPTATGGTITDGTYFLTRMDKWNGAVGANTHQETWLLAQGTIQVVVNNENDSGATLRYAGTYSTSGNMLTLNVTCPGAMAITMPYTASATEVTTINADDPNESHTYTKQ